MVLEVWEEGDGEEGSGRRCGWGGGGKVRLWRFESDWEYEYIVKI